MESLSCWLSISWYFLPVCYFHPILCMMVLQALVQDL
jgi:hypothetical protein